MIDIIIPAYNAHKTIRKTLMSIATQEISNLCKIYIVNDYSDDDYSQIVNDFKDFLNIKELMLKKNSGPGVARQYGIENSNSDYIIFIDADDIFLDCYSLKSMLESIKNNNSDIVIFNFLEETITDILKHENDDTWMHGKIYKRKFLKENNIKFNDTRANEDSGFNKLCLLLNPKIKYEEKFVYVWKYQPDSITRKNNHRYLIDGVEGYTKNIIWAVEEAKKRNCENEKIAQLLFDSTLEIYYYYLGFNQKKLERQILIWSKQIIDYYTKYECYLNDINKKITIRKRAIKLLKNINTIDHIVPKMTLLQFIDLVRTTK